MDVKANNSPSCSDRWLPYRDPKRGQRARMFCFPHAGGGASMFRRWVSAVEWLDVRPVQLPGREGRRNEAPISRIEPLIDTLANNLEHMLSVPYILFGYSMGALIAFELARELRRRHMSGPEMLVVVARRAPCRPDARPPTYSLPNDEFLAELRRFGGTRPEILLSSELLTFYLPVLRADFALCETYCYKEGSVLDCPIAAFGGDSDADVAFNDLYAWRSETRGPVAVRLFPGSHFFFHEATDALWAAILEQILTVVGGRA